MKNKELLGLFLPEGILDYFEIILAENKLDAYYIYLRELNIPPNEYVNSKLISKGYYDESTVQDFPLRGKACYLKVKRRRWLEEETGKIVSRDWNLVARGTRLTSDFATFLKGINR